MPDLMGSPAVEIFSCYGGYVVAATEKGDDDIWANNRYVCTSLDEVVAHVKSAITSMDERDVTSIDKAIKAHKNAQ